MDAAKLLELKFILPMTAILIGGVMVAFGKLEGAHWSAMTTTLVSGFFAVTGWVGQQEVNRQRVQAEMKRDLT